MAMMRVGKFAAAAITASLLASAATAAEAEDYKEQVGLKLVRVSATAGRGAALVEVLNGSRVRLDIEVLCTFYQGEDPVSKGTGVITVPQNKSEALEVRSTRPQKFQKASCSVESAKP
jgi:hypothetical protein